MYRSCGACGVAVLWVIALRGALWELLTSELKSLARRALRSCSSELKPCEACSAELLFGAEALRGVLCGAALRSEKPCEACSRSLKTLWGAGACLILIIPPKRQARGFQTKNHPYYILRLFQRDT